MTKKAHVSPEPAAVKAQPSKKIADSEVAKQSEKLRTGPTRSRGQHPATSVTGEVPAAGAISESQNTVAGADAPGATDGPAPVPPAASRTLPAISLSISATGSSAEDSGKTAATLSVTVAPAIAVSGSAVEQAESDSCLGVSPLGGSPLAEPPSQSPSESVAQSVVSSVAGTNPAGETTSTEDTGAAVPSASMPGAGDPGVAVSGVTISSAAAAAGKGQHGPMRSAARPHSEVALPRTLEDTTYCQTTRNIRVSVQPEFLPSQSEPARNSYAFQYTVTIENFGPESVQLLSRNWRINSGGAEYMQVKGDGVVGEQPTLEMSHGFRYTSGTIIKDPVGSMRGSYTFRSETGEMFDVEIPRFDLIYPHLLH